MKHIGLALAAIGLVSLACGLNAEPPAPAALSLTAPPALPASGTPAPASVAAPSTTATRSAPAEWYAGVNLAGAEFTSLEGLPGVYDTNYTYPTREEVNYFMGKGMNIFRLPFSWENLQHAQFGGFEADELARLDEFVGYATGKGARVILDPHNYARYYGRVVGSADVPAEALADFWGKLADHFRHNPRVIFGLMNEPNTMSSELWRDDANLAILAIRNARATNLILVPGNAWSGALLWYQDWYGTANAVVMLEIADPADNYVFEAHQYLDEDGSGTANECVSPTVGSERLAGFTGWLREHGRRGFLGEFGGARNDTCYAALDDMLGYIDRNADVWLGWTYWAAGPWWEEYIFTVEPAGGVDRPQMAVLSKHLPPRP